MKKEIKKVGVIGAGSFGTTVAKLLALNTDVLMYSRNKEVVTQINENHTNLEIPLSHNIFATDDFEEIAAKCTLIFPVVPSDSFRDMMRGLGPFLRPYHILIHGTKGFGLKGITEDQLMTNSIEKENVCTMSEIITQESTVVRIGCLSGPNLATEILDGQPTASLIASQFDEVISMGKKALSSAQFHVFGSHALRGAELAGALKNMIAIGSGILGGMGMGKNIQAVLITRGLSEMIYYGSAMGANRAAFVGMAGIGDLVATATSTLSRNYTFGMRLGRGESFEEIVRTMPELAEGVRTLKIMKQLAKYYKLHVPITQVIYAIVFEKLDPHRAISYLMRFPYDVDVDFL